MQHTSPAQESLWSQLTMLIALSSLTPRFSTSSFLSVSSVPFPCYFLPSLSPSLSLLSSISSLCSFSAFCLLYSHFPFHSLLLPLISLPFRSQSSLCPSHSVPSRPVPSLPFLSSPSPRLLSPLHLLHSSFYLHHPFKPNHLTIPQTVFTFSKAFPLQLSQ